MNHGTSHVEWFSRGGMTEYIPEEPLAYAKRLSRYISNASTVRIRTLEQFGKAPSEETIHSFIRARQMEKQARTEKAFMYGYRPRAENISSTFKPKPLNAPKTHLKLVEPVEDYETWAELAARCAKMFDLTLEDIKGKNRLQKVVTPRNLVFALLVARGSSMSQTGIRIGERDHTTVINGIKKLFDRDIKKPEVLDAWRLLCPKAFRNVKTYESFRQTLDKDSGTA